MISIIVGAHVKYLNVFLHDKTGNPREFVIWVPRKFFDMQAHLNSYI